MEKDYLENSQLLTSTSSLTTISQMSQKNLLTSVHSKLTQEPKDFDAILDPDFPIKIPLQETTRRARRQRGGRGRRRQGPRRFRSPCHRASQTDVRARFRESRERRRDEERRDRSILRQDGIVVPEGGLLDEHTRDLGFHDRVAGMLTAEFTSGSHSPRARGSCHATHGPRITN